MWRYLLVLAMFGLIGYLVSFQSNELSHLPYEPVYLAPPTLVGAPEMPIPTDNPMTEAGVMLGERLFFDPIFSANRTFSCRSCHNPLVAFSDRQPQSVGVNGMKGERNAPTLMNIGFVPDRLFWDGRVASLEEQAFLPVVHERELAFDWDKLVQRLQNDADYTAEFRAAFGIEERADINMDLTVKALAQYQRSLVSTDSKYDRMRRGEVLFTEAEERGMAIFFDTSETLPKGECGHCHTDPLFTDHLFHNNGVQEETDGTFEDLGRGAITGVEQENGKFRTPTLRNIELTAPYMHDGRFYELEEVLDHYNSGGHFALNVSPNVRELGLSERDKDDLIAFLRTLTDPNLAEYMPQ